jgi:outer membrane protein insertion porin family
MRPSRLARLTSIGSGGALLIVLALSTLPAGHCASAKKATVPQIDFIGNTAFTSSQLQQVLSKAKPRWFDARGALNPNALYEATDNLAAFYYDNGYLNVRVDEPQFAPGGRTMIGIDEGPLYRVGETKIHGNLRFLRSAIASQLSIKSGQPFRGTALRHSVTAVSDFYSDRGYAFIYIDPRTNLDSANHRIKVSLYIKPGPLTYIDQITITGNPTVPESRVKGVLKIHEHDLYSATSIRESKARLDDTALFRQTTFLVQPSKHANAINLEIRVVEKGSKLPT